MKNNRRLAGMLLALIMSLVMTIPTFAVGETTIPQEGSMEGGKITIDPAVANQTYDLYQILYLESYNITNAETGAGQYAYKPTSAWKTFLESTDAQPYITIDSGYVKWKDTASNARAQQFARLALQYAKENGIKPVASTTPTTTSFSFDNLKLGYYLVDTTVGTMCMLNTTNPEFTVRDKNRIPTNVKTVQENADYQAENDIAIGLPINYKSTINAQIGAENYVLHDKMDSGIDFINVTQVIKVDGSTNTPLTAYNPENTDPNQVWDYKLIRPAEGQRTLEDGCAFHIEFSQTFLNTILMGSNIDVFYTGKLNQSAVVGDAGNINTSWLVYGGNSDMETTKSTTTTKTWEFNIFKFTEGLLKSREPLAGATFKLCLDDDVNADALTFSKVDGKENTYKYDPEGTVTEFTTGADGTIYLQGLDQDTYYLFETQAPNGYNKLSSSTTVTIGANGVVYQFTTEAPNKQIAVENNAGSLLPSTGGIGTIIFRIAGCVLLIGAGVLLVVRRRMRMEKEFK